MIHNWELPVARGSLAPGSTREELAQFFTPFSKACLTLLSTDPRAQGTQAHRPGLRDETGPEASFWERSSPGRAHLHPGRPVPPGRTARDPISPTTPSALGPGGSARGRGLPADPPCTTETHPAPERGPGRRTLNLPSRCPRLRLLTPALKLTGPDGRRRPRGARRALSGPGVTPSATRSRARASHSLAEAGGTFGI